MEQKVAVIGVVRETECGKINLRVSNCNRETADAISRDWLAGCFISFEKKEGPTHYYAGVRIADDDEGNFSFVREG